MRQGIRRRNKQRSGIVRMASSNKRVKSKPARHWPAQGPNESSTDSGQGCDCCDMSGSDEENGGGDGSTTRQGDSYVGDFSQEQRAILRLPGGLGVFAVSGVWGLASRRIRGRCRRRGSCREEQNVATVLELPCAVSVTGKTTRSGADAAVHMRTDGARSAASMVASWPQRAETGAERSAKRRVQAR